MTLRDADMLAAENLTIAIVTICRNDLDGLRRTVRSITSQQRQADEIWVIDGASTDGTVDWLASLSEPTIRWTSERDAGIYDALNKGVRLASADLLLFINAGDQIADAEVLAMIEADYLAHRWSWAFGDALVTSGGRVTGHHRLRRPRRVSFRVGAQSVPHQAVVVRRSFLAQVGEFRIDIGPSADQEHILRMWLAAEPRYLGRVVALFDDSGVSASHQAGDFAVHSSHHRALNHVPILGSNHWDRLVTRLVRNYRRSRNAAKRTLDRARRRLRASSNGRKDH